MNTENLYTIKAAANKLGISKYAIYRAIEKNQIQTYPKNQTSKKNAKVDIIQVSKVVKEKRNYSKQDIHTKLSNTSIEANYIYDVGTLCKIQNIERKWFISFVERWGGRFIKEKRDERGGLEKTKISGFELMLVLSKYYCYFYNKNQ